MSSEIHVKAELIEGQHDAAIEFYASYSRHFVSKLVLRLAESLITEYPPSIANFLLAAPLQGAQIKKISLRINSDEHPHMWSFYKDLPYGGKSSVLANVLNSFIQMAEADKRIMERAYWGGQGAAAAVQAVAPVETDSDRPTQQDVAVANVNDKMEAMEGASVEEKIVEPEEDPLFDMVIEL